MRAKAEAEWCGVKGRADRAAERCATECVRAKPRRAAAELGHAGESCGAGQAEQAKRLREVGQKEGREGQLGRGREEERGKGRAGSCAGLKKKNRIFFK